MCSWMWDTKGKVQREWARNKSCVSSLKVGPVMPLYCLVLCCD
jgi:hypothetical protein